METGDDDFEVRTTQGTEASDIEADDYYDDEGEDYLAPVEPEVDPSHEIIHIIAKEKRRTSEILDPNGELANVLLTRVQQIENGEPALIDTANLKSAREIAKHELLAKRTPIKVRRIVREKGNEKWVEEWEISEMVIPSRELKLELGILE